VRGGCETFRQWAVGLTFNIIFYTFVLNEHQRMWVLKQRVERHGVEKNEEKKLFFDVFRCF
jgi:hypothetical protein